MSIRMGAGGARLTVLGSGWSNTAIESGDGFTIDGDLWDDIGDILGYDPGIDVDWDLISDIEFPDFPWPDVIYTDPDGVIYTDPDGDGIWTDPITGIEYPGGGDMWIPEGPLLDISDILSDLADNDSWLTQYSIPNDVLRSLYSGKVTTETNYNHSDSDRPHNYSPGCWYIQWSSSTAYLFLGEPFIHTRAGGRGEVEVFDDAITIRDGSSKAVYYSECTTQFTSNTLPRPYNSYPVKYVCWQCVHGSLSDALISKKPTTITTEQIRNGTSGLQTMTYNGQTYYKVSK